MSDDGFRGGPVDPRRAGAPEAASFAFCPGPDEAVGSLEGAAFFTLCFVDKVISTIGRTTKAKKENEAWLVGQDRYATVGYGRVSEYVKMYAKSAISAIALLVRKPMSRLVQIVR